MISQLNARVSHREPVYAGSTVRTSNAGNDGGDRPCQGCRRRPRLTRNVRIRTLHKSVPTLPEPARGDARQLEASYVYPRQAETTTRLLALAVSMDLHPKAFHLYSAVLLHCARDRWLSIDDMAAVAGVGERQARPFVAELVKAGLLAKRRKVVGRDENGAIVRHRYYVTAVEA